MRSKAAERREIEKARDAAWAMLKKVSSTVVDVVENLESALGVFQDAEGAETLSIMVQQAWEQLEQTGVALSGKAGERFDPKWHRIVKEVPSPEVTCPHVLRVIRRGVLCLGRSVRPADVVVEIPLSKERGE
jgi:molecular chaperone GrpE